MRHSLRFKLLGAFGAVVVLMVVLGILALSKLGSINDSTEKLATSAVPSMQVAGDAQGVTNKLRKDHLRYATSAADDAGRKEAGADIDADLSDFDALVTKYKKELADHADD